MPRRFFSLSSFPLVLLLLLLLFLSRSFAECGTGAHNCAAAATCADTPGSFTCTCQPGFLGTGTACAPIAHDLQSLLSCGGRVPPGDPYLLLKSVPLSPNMPLSLGQLFAFMGRLYLVGSKGAIVYILEVDPAGPFNATQVLTLGSGDINDEITALRAFDVDGDTFLALGFASTGAVIYQVQPGLSLVWRQETGTQLGTVTDLEVMRFGADTILASALTSNDPSTSATLSSSFIYAWDATTHRFELLQSLPTGPTYDWQPVSVDSNHHFAAVCNRSGVQIFAWNSDQQQLEHFGNYTQVNCTTLTAVSNGDLTLLAAAKPAGAAVILMFNGEVFERGYNVTNVDRLHFFTAADRLWLLIEYLSEANFFEFRPMDSNFVKGAPAFQLAGIQAWSSAVVGNTTLLVALGPTVNVSLLTTVVARRNFFDQGLRQLPSSGPVADLKLAEFDHNLYAGMVLSTSKTVIYTRNATGDFDPSPNAAQDGVVNLEFFVLPGHGLFMFLARSRQDAVSQVYRLQPDTNGFALFQDFDTVGATDCEFFTAPGNNSFLAVASSLDQTPVFRFNPVAGQFEFHQNLENVSHAIDLEALLTSDGQQWLAVARSHGLDTALFTFEASTARFELAQLLSTPSASACHAFHMGAASFLAIADSLKTGPTIYQYSLALKAFVLFQQMSLGKLSSSPVNSVNTVQTDGQWYMLLGSDNQFFIAIFHPGTRRFELVGSRPTASRALVHAVAVTQSLSYLAVANMVSLGNSRLLTSVASVATTYLEEVQRFAVGYALDTLFFRPTPGQAPWLISVTLGYLPLYELESRTCRFKVRQQLFYNTTRSVAEFSANGSQFLVLGSLSTWPGDASVVLRYSQPDGQFVEHQTLTGVHQAVVCRAWLVANQVWLGIGNYTEGGQSLLFQWRVDRLVLHQALVFSGVRDFEPMVVGAKHLLAVADGIAAQSVIYQLDPSGMYVELQALPNAVRDFAVFQLQGMSHLVAAIQRDPETGSGHTDSLVYRFDGELFQFLQGIPTMNATRCATVDLGGVPHLIVLQFNQTAMSGPHLRVFRWAAGPDRFEQTEEHSLPGAYAMSITTEGDDVLLAVARIDLSMPQPTSVLRWSLKAQERSVLPSLLSSTFSTPAAAAATTTTTWSSLPTTSPATATTTTTTTTSAATGCGPGQLFAPPVCVACTADSFQAAEYPHRHRVCTVKRVTCAAGTFVSNEGALDADRQCDPCPDGTFQDASRHVFANCKPVAAPCAGGQPVQVAPPTSSSNRICAAVDPNSGGSGGGGGSGAALAASVAGAVVAVLLVVLVAALLVRRRRSAQTNITTLWQPASTPMHTNPAYNPAMAPIHHTPNVLYASSPPPPSHVANMLYEPVGPSPLSVSAPANTIYAIPGQSFDDSSAS